MLLYRVKCEEFKKATFERVLKVLCNCHVHHLAMTSQLHSIAGKSHPAVG